MPRYSVRRDTIAKQIMALAGATYVPEYTASRSGGWFHIYTEARTRRLTGFDWIVPLSSGDTAARAIGAESVSLSPRSVNGVERIRVGGDTLEVDLRPLARRYADSMPARGAIPGAQLTIDTIAGRRRALLEITTLQGFLTNDSLRIDHWAGWLLVSAR
jgi:hypothetical protein